MILLAIIILFFLIAGGLIWFLLSHDHGQKEPITALWIAGGFGFLGAILASIIEYFVLPQSYTNNTLHSLAPILIFSLVVGVIEESCKFLPLAAFIYRKNYFNEHTDGIIYFAIAGLAFGVPENVLYSLSFGPGVGVSRLILTPLFHAAMTSLVGYYLAKSKVEKKSLKMPAMALGAAMLLHGFYDFGLSSKNGLFILVSLMITAGMTTTLFILFMRANELDKAAGLVRVGSSNFCRYCGAANSGHSLYCTHCGRHA